MGWGAAASGPGLRRGSPGVPFDPGDVGVHPALQEIATALADVAVRVVQAILVLDVGLRLVERRHVQVGEHVAQVLLGHGPAGGADGDADDAGRLALPGALAIRSRAAVEGILQDPRNRAVVLRGEEQHAVAVAHLLLEAAHRLRLVAVVVLVVQGQVADADLVEAPALGREPDHRLGELAVEGLLAEAADDEGDGSVGHVCPPALARPARAGRMGQRRAATPGKRVKIWWTALSAAAARSAAVCCVTRPTAAPVHSRWLRSASTRSTLRVPSL